MGASHCPLLAKELVIRTQPHWLRWLLLLGLVILVSAGAGARWLFLTSSSSPHSPWGRGEGGEGATNDQASSLAQTIVCFGYVDLEHGVTPLYPQVPGRVVKIEVRESQSVKAGTVLLRLDDRLARLRFQEAEADWEAAQAQLVQAEKLPEQHRAQLAQQRAALQAVKHRLAGARILLDHKRELKRLQQLNSKEVEATAATVQELEAAEAAELAKLEELQLLDPGVGVKRAQADVKAKQARLEQARQGVDECALTAPTDGAVLRILVSRGEVLGPQPQRPAVVFAPEGQRYIRAEVTQEFAGLVAIGQTATIEDDSGASGAWHGKVSHISDWYAPHRSLTPDPFHVNETRVLECLVELEPDQPPLKLGRRMRVTIGRMKDEG